MDVTEFGEPWLAYKAPFVQRNNGKRHINNYVDWVHFREKQNDVSGNRHNRVYETHNDGKVRSIFLAIRNPPHALRLVFTNDSIRSRKCGGSCKERSGSMSKYRI